MNNLGIHHVSSLVSDIHTSYNFYHNTLGLKLLMKTVNQDELAMYHIFFSDTLGRAGTEFTLFQINTFKHNTFGTNAIERTIFAVPTLESLTYWENYLTQQHIEHYGIEDYGDGPILRFEDPDGLKIGLAVIENPSGNFHPNTTGVIPLEHAILGIHSVHLRLRYPEATQKLLTDWFSFDLVSELADERFPVTVLQNTQGEFHHKIQLFSDKINPIEDQGIGGVHHLALYARDYGDLLEIQEKIAERNFENSGIMPREFFDATYFREPNGLLFEVATKTKTLTLPEEADSIEDVPLYLPDFLENLRPKIMHDLKKIDDYR